MIEVRLEWSIITFDGTVIEAFLEDQPSRRYHIRFVKGAAIASDRRGGQSMQIMMAGSGGILTIELPPEAVQQAQALVAEVERVRASL